MTIREILGAKFPKADFGPYFAFLAGAPRGRYRHHVAPRCEFPGLAGDRQNIAMLSYRGHVRAHQLLSDAVPGHFGFRYALTCMKGQKEEVLLEAAALGGAAAERIGALSKARAVLAAAGHPQIALMHSASNFKETQLDGLAKGRAAMAAAGWPHLVKARKAAGGARAFGLLGAHVQFHVMRSVVSPSCKFCNA